MTRAPVLPFRPTLLPRVAALLATLAVAAPAAAKLAYPETKVQVVADTLYGTVIEDPYRWLEDKDAPATRAWLDQQIALTNTTLGKVPGRDRIVERFQQLLNVESRTVPKERRGRYFFLHRTPGQEQRVLVMRQGPQGKDEVLLDPNPLSPDHTTSVSLVDVSNDGTRLAFGTRRGGEDEQTISLLDVATHKEMTDKLPKARYFNVALRPDGRGLFYARYEKGGSRVYEHTIGEDPARDRLLFGEGRGPEQIIVASLSDDGRWLLVTVYHGSAADKTELWVKDVNADGPLSPIVNDLDARFTASIGRDQLFVSTNWKAPNGRVLAVDLNHPARDAWKEVVPEGPNSIQDLTVAGGRLYVTTLENVITKVRDRRAHV